MTRFCVNVGFLFAELPFLERFAAVRRAGFEAVEFAWPTVPLEDLVTAVRGAGLRVAQMNMDAGDLAAGERGWASQREEVARWRAAFEAALDLAEQLDCPTINVLAGNVPAGTKRASSEACLSDNLHWALPRASARGRALVMEVLNRHDTPAYLFTDSAGAASFVRDMEDSSLRLQLDTYHLARAGEDPGARLRELAPLVGHVQLADAPGRHEPGSGTTDFRDVFAALAATRYAGAVGLEYVPRAGTLAGLGWLPVSARKWRDEAWLPREGRA